MYCDHIERDGENLFGLACENDLEGVVAKRKFHPYIENQASWLKIRNTNYSRWRVARSFSSESGKLILTYVMEWSSVSRTGASRCTEKMRGRLSPEEVPPVSRSTFKTTQ
jgi:ATP-dependent DNA ligase